MTAAAPKSKDFRQIAQGFGVCTIAVFFLYFMTGMNGVYMRELHASVLMAVFTVCCVYYVACAFIKGSKRFLSLLSFIPAFGIYMAVFLLGFKAAERRTLACLSLMESVMAFAGLGTVAVCLLVLAIGKKFESKDLVTAVICAGFVMRTVMVLFTPLNFNQHDVADFTEQGNGFHDGYILYIYYNLALPDGDVRDLGMFYHPPLHYLISAFFFKIHNILPLRFAGDINGLKFLPMLWISYLVLFAKKILEWFDIKGKALAVSLALVSFCPQMIYFAIQVNNDALAVMLFFASVYLALKWYSKPELTTILFLAISIGCSMMTKLSMGFVAFPVALIFLAKLIKTYNEKDARGRKSKNKAIEMIKQFLVFAIVVFPLGLWFSLRNLIQYGTPITYVFEISSDAGQDVWMYPLWQRLFVPSKEILASPFLFEGGEVNDFNIPLALIKTGLFDERKPRDNIYLVRVGQIMLVLAFLLVLAVLVCAVIGAVRRLKADQKNIFAKPEYLALWVLAIVLIGSEVVFCFKHPVVCTEAFRYVAPVLIPAAVWGGSVVKMSEGDRSDKVVKVCSNALTVLVCMFIVAVVLFYGPFLQYSKPWEHFIH